jgi:hypothetical protein
MSGHNGTEIRVLAASVVCGSGFRETSLEGGMRRRPHFIGCDCGSTEPGSYPLGAGATAFPRVTIKQIDGWVARIYGKNGTMGALEPVKKVRTHELCLLFEVTAPTQKIASDIAAITRHQAIHLPIPEWGGLITGVACPYNPPYLERGAVYRFCVNHVVEPDDPYEMFPIEYMTCANPPQSKGGERWQPSGNWPTSSAVRTPALLT